LTPDAVQDSTRFLCFEKKGEVDLTKDEIFNSIRDTVASWAKLKHRNVTKTYGVSKASAEDTIHFSKNLERNRFSSDDEEDVNDLLAALDITTTNSTATSASRPLLLFTELHSTGTLMNMLKNFSDPLPESIMASFVEQIVSGLVYLHKHSFCGGEYLGVQDIEVGKGNIMKISSYQRRNSDHCELNDVSSVGRMCTEMMKAMGLEYASASAGFQSFLKECKKLKPQTTTLSSLLRHPYLRSTTMISAPQNTHQQQLQPYQLTRSRSDSSGGGSPVSSPSSALRRNSPTGSPGAILPGLSIGLKKSDSDCSLVSDTTTPRAGNLFDNDDAGDNYFDDESFDNEDSEDCAEGAGNRFVEAVPPAKKTLTLQQQKFLRNAGK